MISRATKLRTRRLFKRRKKQVEEIGVVTEQRFEKHVIRRLTSLLYVRRFIAGWVGLVLLLIVGVYLQNRALSRHYQVVAPQTGGIFTEGLIGSFTNANPLYASSSADNSVSKLVFSSLLKYDEKNRLVGDLAESWTLDESETVYTVKLKKDVRWHDGQELTSKDVAFTYSLIQNPQSKSPLISSWRGVKIDTPDPHTVVFTLPNSLSAFPHSLTNGIVPEHVLAKVSPEQMRSHSFNNVSPIGSGPFKFKAVEVVGTSIKDEGREERVALEANEAYHNGRPRLDKFFVRTFKDEKRLVDSYDKKQVNSMVGLSAVPDKFADSSETREFGVPLTGEVMVFFKINQDVLKDAQVRKALVLAADKQRILKDIPYPLALVNSPILKNHVGYDKSYAQVTNKPDEAANVLEAAGWVKDPATGVRSKDGVKLAFRLYAQATSEYASVTGNLQRQWRDIGAEVKVELQSDSDLQTTVSTHNYDALLHGISIGPDPDVFAYWHSTQADVRSDTRLNFSEYKSSVVDQALEGGRTRSDPAIRAVKYKPFLEAWNNDAPALALYQPRFLYVVRAPFHGFDSTLMNSASDRFTDVEKWAVREGLEVRGKSVD